MSLLKKLDHISSDRLQYLLERKATNCITEAENVELATYADNFANIIINTPKIRRYIKYNDPDEVRDIRNEMRANIYIVVMGTCPYTFDETAGRAYSYCLSCAYSAVCEIMRRNNRHARTLDVCNMVADLFGKDLFPAKKICTTSHENAV